MYKPNCFLQSKVVPVFSIHDNINITILSLARVGLYAALVFSMVLWPKYTHAQRPPTNFGQGTGNTSNPGQQNQNEQDTGPDSTIYKYVLVNNIYEKSDITDSLADISFLHRHSLYRNQQQHISTGNYGAATQSLIYTPEINTGFFSGYNQYSFYQASLNTFRFYEQNRPLADVYFSQLGGQDNLNVGSSFSRNFADGLSVSLNYNRISQKGFYNGQDTKSTSFGIGLRYQSPKDKYNSFLVFIHNANEEAHIGGIRDVNQLQEPFKKNIAVILSEASTRQQERSIAWVQYYKLNSASSKTWRLYLKNDMTYQPSYYRYSDVNVPDSINTQFYRLKTSDTRGIRRYVIQDQYSNGIYINGERIKGVQGRLGLIYDYFHIKEGISTSQSRSDLTAAFDGKVPILKSLLMETKVRLGLLKNIGNFDISGNVSLKLSEIATLNGGAQLFRSEPSFNTTHLNVNDLQLLDTSYVNPIGTVLKFDIRIPKIKFTVGVMQSVVNKPIYWDTSGHSSQFNDVFTASLLYVSQKIKVGHFHLDNKVYLQVQNNKIYPLPSLFSAHQLYYTGRWFAKVMDVNIGLDARFIADYKGPAYQPLYGEFYQSNTSLPFFPAANLFFMARVSSFRFWAVMENFSQYYKTETNFDVTGHPQFDPKLRFGIQWLLKD